MNERDLEKMKHEAQKQMSDMHSRAHQDQSPPESKENEIPKKDPPPASAKEDPFSVLLKDKDKTIILALILLLLDEGGDQSLIYALMYLLL